MEVFSGKKYSIRVSWHVRVLTQTTPSAHTRLYDSIRAQYDVDKYNIRYEFGLWRYIQEKIFS